MKHFLLAMVLCDNFTIIINKYYLLYMDKNNMNGSFNNLEFLLKIGRYRTEIAYTPFTKEVMAKSENFNDLTKPIYLSAIYGMMNNVTFNVFINKFVFKNAQDMLLHEVIWKYEKNYAMSLCLYSNIHHKYQHIQDRYILLHYYINIYKILYGENVINNIFGEEFKELYGYAKLLCLLFDYAIYLLNQYTEIIKKNILYKSVPSKLTSNINYNKFVKVYSSLFDLNYHSYTSVCLIFIDPFNYIIKGDKMVDILVVMRDNNNLPFEQIITKIDVQCNHDLNDELLESLYALSKRLSLDTFYANSKNCLHGLLEKSDCLDKIQAMIKQHKDKYKFNQIRKIDAISADFYNKYRMKEIFKGYDKYASKNFTSLYDR